jgi:hypothetical protein
MSKQLIDRQEQGRIIAEMNGSVERLDDANYKVLNLVMAHIIFIQQSQAGIAHALTIFIV